MNRAAIATAAAVTMLGTTRPAQAQQVPAPAVAAASVRVAAAPADPVGTTERIAIIDLGPAEDGVARTLLAQAAVAQGLEPLSGEPGTLDLDAAALARAVATAQTAYGALDCAAAVAASRTAMGLGAARQAAGLVDPQLPRALVYMMLCADRAGDRDAAQLAASRLRALGASPTEIPATVWAKYPDVDAVIDRELVPVTIDADVPGAIVWVDLRRVGAAPAHVSLTTTEHVIAVAAGVRRGWALGTAVRAQPAVTIPTTVAAGAWTEVATRVAAWRDHSPAGATTGPTAADLGLVMTAVRAHLVVVRTGDTIVVWGRPGLAGPARILVGRDGAEAGRGTLADASRLIGAAAVRATAWREHAPDPDAPLLTEQPGSGLLLREHDRDAPARWWVYAAVLGAVVAGGIFLYVENAGSDRQRVEVHVP